MYLLFMLGKRKSADWLQYKRFDGFDAEYILLICNDFAQREKFA